MERLREKVLALIGVEERELPAIAEALFHSTEKYPFYYWLYLLISAGIAYFGLIMNSTAVVIGAMLVSPLMQPIIQTGMAFAVGNLYLAVKSTVRIIMSVVFVTLFAAFITIILPFQVITPEIAARTEPTAIDLFVALFCALAAALASSRQSSDTATAAAGTAISIALVPPVCVMGFGLGILDGKVFMGATLLFVANLAAIVLVSDLFFIMAGFSKIDAAEFEYSLLKDRHIKSRLYRFVKAMPLGDNDPRRWAKMKVILPLVFVATIALPLSSALSKVAWEINTKNNIKRVMGEFEKKYQILSRQQVLIGKNVGIKLTIVGDPEDTQKILDELRLPMQLVLGVTPEISINIIPSDKYMREKMRIEAEQMNLKFVSRDILPKEQALLNPEEVRATYHRENLLKAVSESLRLLEDENGITECYAWDISIGNRGNTLVIKRVSDKKMEQAARDILTSYIRKELGFSVVIEDLRTPRTLFSSGRTVSFRDIEKASGKALNDISGIDNIVVEANVMDPLRGRNQNERQQIEGTGKALVAFLKKTVPENHLRINEKSPTWDVTLNVLKAS